MEATLNIYTVRVIGRNRTQRYNIQAATPSDAEARAARIGQALSGGTRDIGRRVDSQQVEGPIFVRPANR